MSGLTQEKLDEIITSYITDANAPCTDSTCETCRMSKMLNDNNLLQVNLMHLLVTIINNPPKLMTACCLLGVMIGKSIAQTEILEDMLTGESEVG